MGCGGDELLDRADSQSTSLGGWGVGCGVGCGGDELLDRADSPVLVWVGGVGWGVGCGVVVMSY